MRRVCLTQSRRSWCSSFQVVDQCLGGYEFNGGCREPEDLYMISCMNASIIGSEQLGWESEEGAAHHDAMADLFHLRRQEQR